MKILNEDPSERWGRIADDIIKSPKIDNDMIKQCYWQLKAQGDTCAKNVSRWLTFAGSAIVVFFLLNRGFITSANLSIVTVTHLTFLAYVIPPFVSLAFLNFGALLSEETVYSGMATAIARKAFPALVDTRVSELFILQSGILGVQMPEELAISKKYRPEDLWMATQLIIIGLCFLSFEVYAYFTLFSNLGFADPWTYSALTATIGLSFIAVLYILGATYE